MSTPPAGFPLPDGPPPGSGYYGGPPMRPVSSNSGCLQAFGITCGVLILLAIIGGAIIVHLGGGILHQGMQAAQAEKNGREIQQAIVDYRRKNGHYPPTLIALVQDGEVNDPAIFNQPPDPPGRISWQYQRPPQNAPGTTPILTLPFQMTIFGHSEPQVMTVDLNGDVSNVPVTPPPPTAAS